MRAPDPVESALRLLRDRDHAIFSTHGPMAVEALEALGHAEQAPTWAEAYRTREGLEPIPSQPALTDAALDGALGDSRRRAAWVARMDAELAESAWPEVVRRWLPRLLPALSCEAAHGVIRLAHAVRSLRRRETPARRHELAEALGYWASAFETLPGGPGRGRPGLASEAIARVPTVPLDEQVFEGSITGRLGALGGLRGFAEAVTSLAPGDDLESFADDLSRTAARLYLVNAARGRVIDFIHALDGVYAVRELVRLLEPADARDALFYAWQTVAALQASAGHPGRTRPERDVEPVPLSEAVARAVAIGGPHAIKFAQACLAEHEHAPDPVHPAALADAVERMERLKQRFGQLI